MKDIPIDLICVTVTAITTVICTFAKSCIDSRNALKAKKFDIFARTRIEAFSAYTDELTEVFRSKDFPTFYKAHARAFLFASDPTRDKMMELMQLVAKRFDGGDVSETIFFGKFDELIPMLGKETSSNVHHRRRKNR